MTVSVLILTLNEESNLPRCLESVRWSDDIVVLDCGSIDRTVEIATSFGARVVHRAFDDWSSHLNWALGNIRFGHDWVYNCDADEIVPVQLREEMLFIAGDKSRPFVAYRLRYKNFFHGRWIRHCGIYPTWVLRFYRPERVRWERRVNPTPVIDGPEGRLSNHFEHFCFSKGFDAWFDKHNRYSTLEAIEAVKHIRGERVDWAGLFAGGDPVRQRRALKELSFRLPFRSFLRFIFMYLLRGGFLDGRPGLTYCRMLSIYENMIVLKMKELKRREKGLPV